MQEFSMEGRGYEGEATSVGRFLQIFNKNNHFRPKELFKAITHQLKAFEKQSKRTK